MTQTAEVAAQVQRVQPEFDFLHPIESIRESVFERQVFNLANEVEFELGPDGMFSLNYGRGTAFKFNAADSKHPNTAYKVAGLVKVIEQIAWSEFDRYSIAYKGIPSAFTVDSFRNFDQAVDGFRSMDKMAFYHFRFDARKTGDQTSPQVVMTALQRILEARNPDLFAELSDRKIDHPEGNDFGYYVLQLTDTTDLRVSIMEIGYRRGANNKSTPLSTKDSLFTFRIGIIDPPYHPLVKKYEINSHEYAIQELTGELDPAQLVEQFSLKDPNAKSFNHAVRINVRNITSDDILKIMQERLNGEYKPIPINPFDRTKKKAPEPITPSTEFENRKAGFDATFRLDKTGTVVIVSIKEFEGKHMKRQQARLEQLDGKVLKAIRSKLKRSSPEKPIRLTEDPQKPGTIQDMAFAAPIYKPSPSDYHWEHKFDYRRFNTGDTARAIQQVLPIPDRIKNIQRQQIIKQEFAEVTIVDERYNVGDKVVPMAFHIRTSTFAGGNPIPVIECWALNEPAESKAPKLGSKTHRTH